MALDALSRVVLKYIQDRNGQTILTKDIFADTGITQTTIRRKIQKLVELGYISREGKKFFVLGKGEDLEEKTTT